MEVLRLLTRQFEDLVAKYKTASTRRIEVSPLDRNRPERRVKDVKIRDELKRRLTDTRSGERG